MPRHHLSKTRVKELFGVERVEPRGRKLRRLNPEEFERTFGMRLKSPISPAKKRRAKSADELFGDMYRVYDTSSITVFRAAADELHAIVLGNMSECPEFVLKYMKKKLEPAVVEDYNKRKVAKLKAVIERAEAALRKLT